MATQISYKNLRLEEGQAMVEYAFILALVAIVCVGTLGAIGSPLNGIFQSVVDGF